MKCHNCGAETSNPKYCSSSCAASVNNKLFPKKAKSQKHCLECNTEFTVGSLYCSRQCRVDYEFKTVTLPRFEAGQIRFTNTLKSILTKLYGYVCAECTQSGVFRNKPLTLQLDHKDGNNKNNLPSNLRLLCPNCHSQTPTHSRHIRLRKATVR